MILNNKLLTFSIYMTSTIVFIIYGFIIVIACIKEILLMLFIYRITYKFLFILVLVINFKILIKDMMLLLLLDRLLAYI